MSLKKRPRKRRAIPNSSSHTVTLGLYAGWAEVFKYTSYFANSYAYRDGMYLHRRTGTFCETDMLLTICKDFYHNVFRNESYDVVLWKQKCQAVWKDKVPSSYLRFQQLNNTSWRVKLHKSVIDSRRTSIHTNELCENEFGMRSRGNDRSDDPYWIFYIALLDGGDNNLDLTARQHQILHDNPGLKKDDRFEINPLTATRTFHADGTISNPTHTSPDEDGMPYQYQNNEVSPITGDDRCRWKLTKTKGNLHIGGKLCLVERTESWGWLIQPDRENMIFIHPKKDMPLYHLLLEKGQNGNGYISGIYSLMQVLSSEDDIDY